MVKRTGQIWLIMAVGIALTVGLTLVWEFLLEEIVLGSLDESYVSESLTERWEYVVVALVIVCLAEIVPIILLSRLLRENKELRGIIPICANCKQIRDDKGFWAQVEVFIEKRSDAMFSHSICPVCVKKLYPGLDK